jgi:hypothetical protein
MNDSSAVMGEKAKGARGVNLGPVPTARSYRSPRERDAQNASLQCILSFDNIFSFKFPFNFLGWCFV